MTKAVKIMCEIRHLAQKKDTKTREPNFISSLELANPKTMATNNQTSLPLYFPPHL